MKKSAWLRRYPLLGFFALTFLWSWMCWLLALVVKTQSPSLATVLMFTGSFGPSLAAIAIVSISGGRAGLRAWYSRCLQWHVGWRWLAFAFFFPLVVVCVAAGTHIALGGEIAASPALARPLMTAMNFFLVMLLGGPLDEEFGWRGYALPALQNRLGWRMASLGLGAVWGAWHLPLFFIDGTSQAHIPLALFLLSVLAMSVLFAWLVNHTAGSVVAALVLHTAINFWPNIVPVLPTDRSHRPYALVVAMLVLMALWLLAPHRVTLTLSTRRSSFSLILGVAFISAAALIGWQFHSDMQQARAHAAQRSVLLKTRCGPIEYQEAGTGAPLLAVHGSGGGHDQGMAFAGSLAQQGIRVIAMSRFGYLRTPMPADGTAAAQADAHVCLLDALGIARAAVMGGSAGGLSALQMALRHPDRVSALVLLVPLAYKPPTQTASAPPMQPWVEKLMMRMIGSDFLFWAALHVARDQVIKTVLATQPELLTTASRSERARVKAMLENILPVSDRAAGLKSDTAVGKHLQDAPLESIRLPTLIISARDDRYGTYANAQYTASRIPGAKFIGFEEGGHTWVGHNDEVMAEIVKLLDALGNS